MQVYNFDINTYRIDVTVELKDEYHVSPDGVFAGIIFPEFLEEAPFTIWRSKDLIPEDLLQKIGAAIEREDRSAG